MARPFVPAIAVGSPACRRGPAGPLRVASRGRRTPGSAAWGGTPRRPVAVRRGGTDPRVAGGAASDRRERGSAGSRLHGAEPARVRTASVRALGERRRPTRRPRSTGTATGSPIRSTRRSTRSRPRGGSRSCAWGSARRSPTGPRPTTVRTTSWTSTWRTWERLGLGGYVATDDPHAERRQLPVPRLLGVRRRRQRLLGRAARCERRLRRSARDRGARVLPRGAVRVRLERGRVADGGHRRVDGGPRSPTTSTPTVAGCVRARSCTRGCRSTAAAG